MVRCTGCRRLLRIPEPELGPETGCPVCGAELVPHRPWRVPPVRGVLVLLLPLGIVYFGIFAATLWRDTSALWPSVAEAPVPSRASPARAIPAAVPHRTTDEWLQLLCSGDLPARVQAARELGHRGKDAARAVPVLAGAVRSPIAELRRAAIAALGALGPLAGRSAPELLSALRLGTPESRPRTARALAAVLPGAPEFAAGLRPALSDPSPAVRQGVREALIAAGDAALPVLLSEAGHGSEVGRTEALKALAAHPAPSLPVALTLAAELGHPDPELARAAALAVGMALAFGPEGFALPRPARFDPRTARGATAGRFRLVPASARSGGEAAPAPPRDQGLWALERLRDHADPVLAATAKSTLEAWRSAARRD